MQNVWHVNSSPNLDRNACVNQKGVSPKNMAPDMQNHASAAFGNINDKNLVNRADASGQAGINQKEEKFSAFQIWANRVQGR